VFAAGFLYQQTNALKIAQYVWPSQRVPPAFAGYRIVQVSDLHNKRFGRRPYSGGIYREGDSVMVLSRGLGTTALPLRVFAAPELVVVELKTQK
jgi:predicted MPP superfamily phosphohydrolase